MRLRLLLTIFAGLLLIMVAGCGGSSDGTSADEQSNQGITFNKYSKGSSSGKTDSSLKSTKPSNNTSNQTGTDSDDPTQQQAEKPAPTTTPTINQADENNLDSAVQNNQSGTTTTSQPSESQNDQEDEINNQSGNPGSLPCRFVGSILIGGSDALPGTLVEAYVDSEKVGEWITKGKGYKLDVTGSHPNKMVSIRVNGVTAAEEPWEKGGYITLNLSIP